MLTQTETQTQTKTKIHLTSKRKNSYSSNQLNRIAASCYHEINYLAQSITEEKENKSEIPKIIHQTYKSVEKLPPNWKQSPTSWKISNPDYIYSFWSDEENETLIRTSFPWFLPIYEAYPHFIMRVDAFRPFLLWKFGGWYIDMDLQGKEGKNLNELLLQSRREFDISSGDVDTILLPDAYAYFMDEQAPFQGLLQGNVKVTNCLIGSKPQTPFLLLVIRIMCERGLYGMTSWWSKLLPLRFPWWTCRRDFLILQSTGPGLWTEALRFFDTEKYYSSMHLKRFGIIEKITNLKQKTNRNILNKSKSKEKIKFEFQTLLCKTKWKTLSPILRSLIQKRQKQSRSIIILPNYSIFPALSLVLKERPITVPTSYVTLQEGYSWVPSQFDRTMTKMTLKSILFLQMTKNNVVFHQIATELQHVLANLNSYSPTIKKEIFQLLPWFPTIEKRYGETLKSQKQKINVDLQFEFKQSQMETGKNDEKQQEFQNKSLPLWPLLTLDQTTQDKQQMITTFWNNFFISFVVILVFFVLLSSIICLLLFLKKVRQRNKRRVQIAQLETFQKSSKT